MKTRRRKSKRTNILVGVILLLIIMVVAGIVFFPKVNIESKQIELGVIVPLSGPAATLGQNVLKSMNMAAQEININGGVNGQKIRLVAEDGKCNAKDASLAANKLVNLNGVKIILGGLCSAETMAVAPITNPAKVVTLSPCSSNPSITNAGDYIFRIYPSDSYQGVYAAKLAFEKLNAKTIAVLDCQDVWCEGVKKTFVNEYKKLGGIIVSEEKYLKTDIDMKTQLTRIKSKNPDLIYFLGPSEPVVVGLKQIKELGINAKILGGDPMHDTKIWKTSGSVGEGAMYTLVKSKSPDSFQAKLKSYGGDTTLCAANGYDTVKVIADVITKVGTDSLAVKNALYNVDHQGMSGRIRLDSNGDLVGAEYEVRIVKNGEAVLMS